MSDVNDNSPVFQTDFINLPLSESIVVGTPVLNLLATDADFGLNGQVNYTIISEQGTGLSEGITSLVSTIPGITASCTLCL